MSRLFALSIRIWLPTCMKLNDEKRIMRKSFDAWHSNSILWNDQSKNTSKYIQLSNSIVVRLLYCIYASVLLLSYDCSHVFWIGDLNYRLVNSIPRSKFDTDDFSAILKSDQLHQEMQRQRVFRGYTEGPITFRPTYRYDPGTDDWDSSEKQRAPAWCDRILWKGERIQQLQYKNVMSLRLSDHKPVYAEFLAGVIFLFCRKISEYTIFAND